MGELVIPLFRRWRGAVRGLARRALVQVKGTSVGIELVLMRKRERLFAGYRLDGKVGVEIGPLCYPMVERPKHRVYYVDHCSTAELRQKYEGHPNIPAERIVDVDFVWGDSDLKTLLGEKAPVDYVVASHVIEHVPDLIGWLFEMHAVLNDGGQLMLVVPDKRFTFDVFRRCSAWEEIRLAHDEKRRKPGIRCVMDHFSNVVAADTWKMWEDYTVVDSFPFNNPPSLLEVAAREIQEGKYIDVHCWVFTPWHLLDLLGRIVRATGLGFDLDHFATTPSHNLEFYVRLKKVAASGTDWDRAMKSAHDTALWPNGRQRAVELAG